ncbi:MAG TPA: hypothetical protein VIV60_06905 [Polyangiaceae bacterium]
MPTDIIIPGVPSNALPLATASAPGASSGNGMAALLAAAGLVPVELANHTCGVGETSFVIPCVGAMYSQLRVSMDFPGGLTGVVQNPKIVSDTGDGRATAIYTATHSTAPVVGVPYSILGFWATTWSLEANFRRSVISGEAWAYTSNSHNVPTNTDGDMAIINGWLPQWSANLTFALNAGGAFPTGTKITVTAVIQP